MGVVLLSWCFAQMKRKLQYITLDDNATVVLAHETDHLEIQRGDVNWARWQIARVDGI